MKYYQSKTVNDTFENTEKRIREALTEQGFGINMEIDISNTFKEKLNKPFRKYKLLGACNPENAYQAIEIDRHTGALLPCNVVLQEHAEGEVEISVVNPEVSLSIVENKEVSDIAKTISSRLSAALESVK